MTVPDFSGIFPKLPKSVEDTARDRISEGDLPSDSLKAGWTRPRRSRTMQTTSGGAFRPASTMTQVPNRSWADSPELAPKGKKAVPEGLWIRCPQCAAMLFRKSVENNLWVCPECRHHFRVSAKRRIAQLTDPGSFEPFNEHMTPVDPLNFVAEKRMTFFILGSWVCVRINRW